MRLSRSVLALSALTVVLAPLTIAPTPALAAGRVKIAAVYFDPGPGPDPAAQLNQEYVVLRNSGSHAVRLTGWKLHDKPRSGSVNTYRFPRFRLRPGKTVRIHTGKGTRTRTDLYWGLTYYVWGDDSDVATLVKRSGTIVDRCAWKSSTTSPKFC